MAEHRCFELHDDETGATARIHGDPDMPEEAKRALLAIVRAAYRQAVDDDAAPLPEGGGR